MYSFLNLIPSGTQGDVGAQGSAGIGVINIYKSLSINWKYYEYLPNTR